MLIRICTYLVNLRIFFSLISVTNIFSINYKYKIFFDFSEIFGHVTIQLVGGLKEESGKGGVLSKRILSFFATHQCNFIPTLICLGPVNTRIRTRAEPIVGKNFFSNFLNA